MGRYTDGDLALDNPLIRGYDSSGNPVAIGKANCRANCLECIPRKLSNLALVVPGDFYFVAFAPVHSRDPENALECGEARGNLGADFVQVGSALSALQGRCSLVAWRLSSMPVYLMLVCLMPVYLSFRGMLFFGRLDS